MTKDYGKKRKKIQANQNTSSVCCVYVPLKVYTEALTPSLAIFGGGACKEVIKVKWGHKGGLQPVRIVFFFFLVISLGSRQWKCQILTTGQGTPRRRVFREERAETLYPSLSVCLSLLLSVSPLCVSPSLSFSLSLISLSLSLSLHLSVSFSLCLSISLPLLLSGSVSSSLSVLSFPPPRPMHTHPKERPCGKHSGKAAISTQKESPQQKLSRPAWWFGLQPPKLWENKFPLFLSHESTVLCCGSSGWQTQHSCIRRFNYVEMVTLPKLVYRFNETSIKIPAGLFVETDKLTLTCLWELKGCKTALKKRNMV